MVVFVLAYARIQLKIDQFFISNALYKKQLL